MIKTIAGIHFKATAATPRLYRATFARDLYKDFAKIQKSISEEDPENSDLDIDTLTTFENITYIMAKQADPTIPDSADEWLDSIDGVFSIYTILPQIIDLWQLNTAETSTAKKN